jgi:hypothetical protein
MPCDCDAMITGALWLTVSIRVTIPRKLGENRAGMGKAWGGVLGSPKAFFLSHPPIAFAREHSDAGVAKLADAPDLGSGAARRGGSSPSTRTIYDQDAQILPTEISAVVLFLGGCMVAPEGLEPSRPYEPQILSLVCLPVPARGHGCSLLYMARASQGRFARAAYIAALLPIPVPAKWPKQEQAPPDRRGPRCATTPALPSSRHWRHHHKRSHSPTGWPERRRDPENGGW